MSNKPKIKDRIFIQKAIETNINDIDQKQGIVQVYVSAFGNVDKVGDVIEKGAFQKTIKEQGGKDEIYFYRNHNKNLVPAIVLEAKEDDFGLLMTAKILKGTAEGDFAMAFYNANAEAGKKVKHSIGYYPVKEKQEEEANYVKEVFLVEGSMLTTPPANSNAIFMGMKSDTELDLQYLLTEKRFVNNLLNADLSELELKELQKLNDNINSLIEIKTAATRAKEIQNPNIVVDFLTELNSKL